MSTPTSADAAHADQQLREEGNLAYQFLLADFDMLVKQRLGAFPWEYVPQWVNRCAGPVNLLSLCCAQGALELHLAAEFRVPFRFDCLDADADALAKLQRSAQQMDLSVRTLEQDIETLNLPAEEYDLIIAHACLHCARNLEHIFTQVHRALTPDGQFLVNDIVPRNGWRLWPDTYALLERLWAVLPNRLKVDRTSDAMNSGYTMWLARLIEGESGIAGYDCPRPEDILPLLRSHFHIEVEVPGYAFARRLLGHDFGSNYQMHDSADRSAVEFILSLDKECVAAGRLRPENVFVLASKRRSEGAATQTESVRDVQPAPDVAEPSQPTHHGLATERGSQDDLIEQFHRERNEHEALLRERDEFLLSQKATFERAIKKQRVRFERTLGEQKAQFDRAMEEQKAAYEQLEEGFERSGRVDDPTFAAKVNRLYPLYHRIATSLPYRLVMRLGLMRFAKSVLRVFLPGYLASMWQRGKAHAFSALLRLKLRCSQGLTLEGVLKASCYPIAVTNTLLRAGALLIRARLRSRGWRGDSPR